MTPAQNRRYWREWNSVLGYCKLHDLEPPDRKAIHRETIGSETSSKHLTDPQFEAILAAFMAITQPDNLAAQVRPAAQPRIRCHYKLTVQLPYELAVVLDHPAGRPPEAQLAAAENYIMAILRDKYRHTNLADLSEAQLQSLIIDVTRSINTRRTKKTLTWPQLRATAAILKTTLTRPPDPDPF